MSRKPRFSIILAAMALLAAAAVLAIMVGMDRGSPGEVAYASDPGSDGETMVVALESGGLTTRAIDLPAVQDHCRSQTAQHYEDCVTVHKVLDSKACAGSSDRKATWCRPCSAVPCGRALT